MAANDWTDVFAGGAPAPGDLRDALLRNAELVLPTASAVTTTDLAGCRALKVLGISYYYDASDTTSAHDGVSILVSNDGRRYKIGQPQFVPNRVEGYQNAPPGSPVLGDAWLVGTAPSGAWAANADDVAVYTVNGWVFISAAAMAGRILYVADEDSSYQYGETGWRKGLGASTLGDGTVRPNHLAGSISRFFSVEDQGTNTPPGSPSDGVAYVIGPSPTGAWSGHAAKIAVWQDAAWAIFTPAEGWMVWDKSVNGPYFYDGTTWFNPISSAQAVPRYKSAIATTQFSKTIVGATVYTYSDSTAPTTSSRRIDISELSLVLAATSGSRWLFFEFDGFDYAQLVDTAYDPTVAVFRDSETTAIAWGLLSRIKGRLASLTADASSHTYRFALTTNFGVGATKTVHKNVTLSVMEVP